MDVVVVGAGLSGLTAASLLLEAGINVRLVEAGKEIGGRIRSLRDPTSGRALADLGSTWVWPKYQPVVARWIDALRVETFEQFNDGDAIILGYGPEPIRQPLPGQHGMVRLAGGPTALIDALAKQIGLNNIRCSTPVTGLFEYGPKRISVQLGSGEILPADKVIVAVPLRVAVTTLDLSWAPQPLINAMRETPTWMSTHAKAVALYERPFWRSSGLSGRIASRNGPLVEADDHTGIDGAPAAIFGFVGWPPVVRQEDPEGLRQAVLMQLTECFGEDAAHPTNFVLQDWATNPHIVTELDISQPSSHPEIGLSVLRQPHMGGSVWFAVSEASDVSPGLIEGALAAGERAALSVLRNSD